MRLYCGHLKSYVAYSWLCGRVAAACVLSLGLQGQLCDSVSGLACGRCDRLRLLGYAVPHSSQVIRRLAMKSQLVSFLFGRWNKQKAQLLCRNVPCECSFQNSGASDAVR